MPQLSVIHLTDRVLPAPTSHTPTLGSMKSASEVSQGR